MEEVIYDKSKMLVPVKIWARNLDEGARQQAINCANLPCVFSHVAVMADGHKGFGVSIGSVVATKKAIIPNAVGSDIGCGINYWNSGVHKSQIDTDKLMNLIKDNVPHGMRHGRDSNDEWLKNSRITTAISDMNDKYEDIMQKHNTKGLPSFDKAVLQLGDLGNGNHMFEIQHDDKDNICFMIHSGSRNLGGKVAKVFHDKAVNVCRKYHTRLPTEDLAFMPDDCPDGVEYIAWLKFAQDFAYYNRSLMMIIGQNFLLEQVGLTNNLQDVVNIHHNYAAMENHFGENVWIHRKGATLARKTTVGLIPGSMCTKSFVVNGKGNPESFSSCSHGAGRNFSRTQARNRVDLGIDPPQISQLGSVKLYGISKAHDELGSAYKNIDEVISQQKDLVEVLTELTPIATLKG